MKFHQSVLTIVSALIANHGTTAQDHDISEEAPQNLRGGLSDEACPVFSQYPSDDEVAAYVANPGDDGPIKDFLDAVQPCGHYKSQGCPYEVIPANVVFPGEGVGDIEFVPYITQFDVGLHQAVKDTILAETEEFQLDNFISPEGNEVCVEIIVKAGNSRNDATLSGCAGKCGPGCIGAGWARDCLKHDTCVTYKNYLLMAEGKDTPSGFCNDLDCGDEGAQTLMECYRDVRFGFDEDIICDEHVFNKYPDAYGFWSPFAPIFAGRCQSYEDWSSGQGIPNESQIRYSDEFAELQSQDFVDDSVVMSK